MSKSRSLLQAFVERHPRTLEPLTFENEVSRVAFELGIVLGMKGNEDDMIELLEFGLAMASQMNAEQRQRAVRRIMNRAIGEAPRTLN